MANYVFTEPREDEHLKFKDHFSSLLLSGDVFATVTELVLLSSLTVAAHFLPATIVNVSNSMQLSELAWFFWVSMIVTRLYNSYLEACWFAFPQYRTQPASDHKLKGERDLCGRDLSQLKALVTHDRLTMISQFLFGVAIYYLIPGYYPAAAAATTESRLFNLDKLLLLVSHHYLMSFGMYWGHRAYHINRFLWKRLHSVHHWAKHPLSRNTYQDHWLENLLNHINGHFAAQILLPLPSGLFWFSHIFRILESLEKHSGISCHLNLAHEIQRMVGVPYAQMPYHHDWHHEGHKASNFTFSSIGGLWDCIFGTRATGRPGLQETRYDSQNSGMKSKSDIGEYTVLIPLIMVLVAVSAKLLSPQPMLVTGSRFSWSLVANSTNA